MHNLLKLFADNRQVKGARRFEIVNDAGSDSATIYLYDTIVSSQIEADWCGGVAAEAFCKALNAVTAGTIHLRINSPGGDVFAARTMEGAIRAHPSNIVGHVDGYAASAASFVALACDSVEINDGAFFMVHKSWCLAYGNADDLLEMSALLEQIDATLVATYVRETGQSKADVEAMLAAETWIGAEDAVKLGFADSICKPSKADAAKARIDWNLSALGRKPAEPAAPGARDDRFDMTLNVDTSQLDAALAKARELYALAAPPGKPKLRAAMDSETECDCVCPACSAPLVMSMSMTCELETPAAEAAEPEGANDSRDTARRLLNHLEKFAA